MQFTFESFFYTGATKALGLDSKYVFLFLNLFLSECYSWLDLTKNTKGQKYR